MSELITPIELKKANKAYLMRTIGECLKLGVTHMSFSYKGSNIDLKWIDPDKQYIGFGSVGDLKGDDIAKELNTMYAGLKQAQAFIAEHFYHVKIG